MAKQLESKTTMRLRVSIWYEVDGEQPEIRESSHTYHRLPDQKQATQAAVDLINNFYVSVTG